MNIIKCLDIIDDINKLTYSDLDKIDGIFERFYNQKYSKLKV